MKIVAVETMRSVVQPNLCIVQLHTDEGLTGVGETFYGARAVEAYIHESVAQLVIAEEQVHPEHLAQKLTPYVGYQGAGAEMRGNSAIDMALWDLLGKSVGRPVYELLGGPVRESVPIYNTCAGPNYIKHESRQSSDNWGINQTAASHDQYEDLTAFLTRPGKLAQELLDSSIRGMKIWPFDLAAERTGGSYIDPDDLRDGIDIIAAIRDTVGSRMRLMIEMHGLWQYPGALSVLKALEPYDIAWVEDPVRPDNIDAVSSLARSTSVPIATGETLCGRRAYRSLLEEHAIDVAIVDIAWSGGLTEARKIASLADSYGIPTAPHDCTGPVSLAAAVHLLLAVPNGLVQETCRAFNAGWYTAFTTAPPDIRDGHIHPPPGPGLGVELHPDLPHAPHISRHVSAL